MDPEPLPEGHLRWKTPNLLLMQHVAGSTPKFIVRTMQFATDQVDRYIKGESLQNVVTGEYCPPAHDLQRFGIRVLLAGCQRTLWKGSTDSNGNPSEAESRRLHLLRGTTLPSWREMTLLCTPFSGLFETTTTWLPASSLITNFFGPPEAR